MKAAVASPGDLPVPLIDIADPQASKAIRDACTEHGFFYGKDFLHSLLTCFDAWQPVARRACLASLHTELPPFANFRNSTFNFLRAILWSLRPAPGRPNYATAEYAIRFVAPSATYHCHPLESVLFAVTNHGVGKDLIDRQFEESRNFFSLPYEEKLKVEVGQKQISRFQRTRAAQKS